MASLKEIRERIGSVSSTKKITSAMKMVSAAKLHKAEERIARFLPYQKKLTEALLCYLQAEEGTVNIRLAQARQIKHLTLVAVSSDTGLCGTFNSNISKLLQHTLLEYKAQGISEVTLIPIGKKIAEQAAKHPVRIDNGYRALSDNPDYASVSALSTELTRRFEQGETDCIVLLYNNFKNAGVQIPTAEQWLPLQLAKTKQQTNGKQLLYLAEPDPETYVNNLAPMVLRMRLFAAILNSIAAEHGARTTAMQVASENAEQMIGELTQQYNRARQDVITTELIDIVGGSEALRN